MSWSEHLMNPIDRLCVDLVNEARRLHEGGAKDGGLGYVGADTVALLERAAIALGSMRLEELCEADGHAAIREAVGAEMEAASSCKRVYAPTESAPIDEATPTTESVGRRLDDLRVRLRSAGASNGWSSKWHGKRGDVVDEAGDVLLACLMGLVPESVPLAECLAAAERKVGAIAARTCGVDGAAAKQQPAQSPAGGDALASVTSRLREKKAQRPELPPAEEAWTRINVSALDDDGVGDDALCLCGHEWRRHDPEDGMCDAPEPEPAAGRPAAACKCGVDIAFHRRLNAQRARAALEFTP